MAPAVFRLQGYHPYYVPDINTRPGGTQAGTGFRQEDVPREKGTPTWSTKYPEHCRRVNTPVWEGRTFVYLPEITEGGTSHECIRGRAFLSDAG